LTGPKVLRPIFALLRRLAPILMVGKRAVINRHADVVEVLTRDADFTVSQINAPNINRLDGPFILGMVSPREFRIDRNVEYLHFGYGMHRCFGYLINGVQIPEVIASLLRLPNLRRSGSLEYEGPFPQRMLVEFD
jgi:hypothetical protein